MYKKYRDQFIAISLTILTCLTMVGFLFLEVKAINHFSNTDIELSIKLTDILIGMTIYLKTSIDFAMFIGRLMERNPGLKGRIGIEIGTALGNAAGTLLVLLIWSFFKEVNWLLALMIILAAFVLFRLAQDGLEHIDTKRKGYPNFFKHGVNVFDKSLSLINKSLDPLLSRIIPGNSMKVVTKTSFLGLLAMAFTIPFILGLDDFAGYVPLFNVVHVFGFAIGVFVGHMLLNILLYLSPTRTIKAVKNPIISLLGSIAFVILAVWGLIEAFKLLFLHH